jgi:hypothetical protein
VKEIDQPIEIVSDLIANGDPSSGKFADERQPLFLPHRLELVCHPDQPKRVALVVCAVLGSARYHQGVDVFVAHEGVRSGNRELLGKGGKDCKSDLSLFDGLRVSGVTGLLRPGSFATPDYKSVAEDLVR